MLENLAPHHRAKLASLLADTPEFTAPEVDVALELVDAALAEPERGDYRFVLFERDERVLGYACYGPTPMTDGTFDLYWLVIDRAVRRTGLGGLLLSNVERRLASSGARLLRLETAGLSSYDAARRFYLRQGYQLAGRIRDFYWVGNDLHVYVKYLAGSSAA
jgi:ribosomal protein S18 acetylase RimI-like enzyme